MNFTNKDIAGKLRGKCAETDCDCPGFMGLNNASEGIPGTPWSFCQYCNHPPTLHSSLLGE